MIVGSFWWSATACTGPPSTETRTILPLDENASERLSGDQHGLPARLGSLQGTRREGVEPAHPEQPSAVVAGRGEGDPVRRPGHHRVVGPGVGLVIAGIARL